MHTHKHTNTHVRARARMRMHARAHTKSCLNCANIDLRCKTNQVTPPSARHIFYPIIIVVIFITVVKIVANHRDGHSLC